MGKTRFEECLAFVLEREGGYSNDPVDRGGATNYGITQRVYDEWCLRKGREMRSVEHIEQFEVCAIYSEQYWNRVRGVMLPPPLDLVVFDSAVNHGHGRAIRWLQEIVGAVTDGVIGDETLKAMRNYITAHSLPVLVDLYLERRMNFYDAIIAHDRTQARFEKGWKNRVDALARTTAPISYA